MKPTLGRVPHPWGFDDPNHLLSVIGQIGRDVEDVALTLDWLTAWEPSDPLSCPAFAHADAMATLKHPLARRKLAYSRDLGCGFAVDADVGAALDAAVRKLAAAGWVIEEAGPAFPGPVQDYPLIALQQVGLAQLFGEVWRRTPDVLDPDIGAQIEIGWTVSATQVAGLLRLRERIHAGFDRLFAQYDALLCPVAPVEAWPLGRLGPPAIGGRPAAPRDHAAFTPLFNYANLPAISIPCGAGRSGLPVGMQIAGPRFADARVLHLAWHAEQVLGTGQPSALMRRSQWSAKTLVRRGFAPDSRA